MIRNRNWITAALGSVFLLLGIALAAGGGYLISLGGSWFYLLAGLAWAAGGYAIIRKQALGLVIILGLLLVSLIWAFWEVGADFWQVVPRVIVFLVVAIVTAAVSPLLLRGGNRPALPNKAAAGVALSLAVALVGVFVSMFRPHAEVVAQTDTPAEVINPTAGEADGDDWVSWARNQSGHRYAQFTQINKKNVTELKEAWTYRTGDLAINGAEYQVTPLKVDDTLYLCTPFSKVIALNPESGKELWRFDPKMAKGQGEGDGGKGWQRCRGVAYTETPTANPAEACQARIVLTTIDARLITLDSKTGEVCPNFGENGSVNLYKGLGPRAPGTYFPTSAPTVAGDVVVVGGLIGDNDNVGQPSGVVRAYNVRTGAITWAWDPANPKRGTPLPEGEVYAPESPNFWGTAAYDPELGLVYIPTGNQTPDFFNGNRHDYSDEYNDSIVAIDVKTGVDKWHFRTTNRDMFDYDVSTQPILYDLPKPDGSVTPVVIQMTKRGEIFVLDRRDGTPVYPVENRAVPTDAMPGMKPAATQPFSSLSIGADPLKESDMWGASIFDQLYCRIQFKKMRWEGPFTPLSDKQRTLIWPGYYGGMNWGGGALDPTTGTLIVNDIRMAMWARFMKREDASKAGLVSSAEGEYSQQLGTPWGVERSMFLSPLGTPCFKPPFGSMTAIDLRTGKTKWQVPMGTLEDARIRNSFLPKDGIVSGLHIPVGMPTLGGPTVTKGGLTFFHGSLDYYLRALDNDTGEELWRSRLPVGGQGAPMTYIGKDGRQYVVVVAGGATRTGTNADRGDYVIAYALPDVPKSK